MRISEGSGRHPSSNKWSWITDWLASDTGVSLEGEREKERQGVSV